MFTENISRLSFNGFKPLTKAVDTDFYTGKFVPKERRTIEHIKPKSKGGHNSLRNYAMTDTDINNQRGNKNLIDWIKEHSEYLDNMKAYIQKYWDTYINGVPHGKTINKTIKDILGVDLSASV